MRDLTLFRRYAGFAGCRRPQINEAALKLNLGCGFRKLEGWTNVDKRGECAPDEIVDLEKFPWPWPDSSAEEIRLTHVLEHIGSTPTTFLNFIKELWRICQTGATIKVLVPHPRSDEFLWDPTHVRPITAEGLRMFSQVRNQEMIRSGNPETPLGIYIGVDFDLLAVKYIWKKPWADAYIERRLTDQDLSECVLRELNVAKEIEITLQAVKPPRGNGASHGE